MRRLLTVLLVLAAIAAGLVAARAIDSEPRPAAGEPGPALREFQRRLAGAPPPLAALHRDGNRLLDGGVEGFRARLAQLRGYPVVVNVWGSWCGPCRAEFPVFQRAAVTRGREVAFLGIDTVDNDENARRFLSQAPLPYPSFKDPGGEVAQEVKAVSALPATVFFDRRGGFSTIRQGQYRSEAELLADIDRYAR